MYCCGCEHLNPLEVGGFTVTLFKWQYSYLLISTELQRVGIGLNGLTIMLFQGEEIIIILFCFLFEPDYSVLLRATSDL